ncbi:MAG: tetratricopeptide repeat protein [Pseudomonadota bacterium]
MAKIWMAILAVWVGIAGAAGAQASQYFTDPDLLPAEHKALYESAKREIDGWSSRDTFPQTAVEDLKRLVELEPDFLPLYLQQARLAVLRGMAELDRKAANREAEEILKAVIAKQPRYADAYTHLAGAYINGARYDEAREVLEAAGRLDVQEPWLFCVWSRLLGKMGEFADALDYGEACLNEATEDPDAFVEALFRINRYRVQLGRPLPDRNVGAMVFERFEDPNVRVYVAEQLIDSYDGFPGMLAYAFQILTQQQSETPELPAAKLHMARLLHKKAALGSAGYDQGIRAYVLELLAPIEDHEALRDEVFELRFRVDLHKQDMEAAADVLDRAEAQNKVSKRLVKLKRAELYFHSGNYEMAILTYEQLGLKYHPLLIESYKGIGRLEEVDAYYRRLVRDEPNQAWSLGNYASFLLIHYDDVEGAINYGERAVAILNYPLARSNLGLAYLIRAAQRFEAGNLAAARADYKRSIAQRPTRFYVERYCKSHCEAIEAMTREIRKRDQEGPAHYEH